MIFVVVSAASVDRKNSVPSERAVSLLWHLSGNPVHLWWYRRLWCIGFKTSPVSKQPLNPGRKKFATNTTLHKTAQTESCHLRFAIGGVCCPGVCYITPSVSPAAFRTHKGTSSMFSYKQNQTRDRRSPLRSWQ
jgi:hypothetical protein